MGLDWLNRGLGRHTPETQGYAALPSGSDEKPPEAAPAPWLTSLTSLLPSFLHPSTGVSSGRRASKTAWLDGLRGIAAFIVVWHHSSLVYFPWSIHDAWTPDSGLFIQLPIVRLALAGIPAVCVFFVISGYAISLRLLQLSHLGRPAEFADALASSLFRRHPRLFMPAASVMLLTALMSYMGAFPTEAWSEHVAIAIRNPPRADTLWAQLLDWGRRSSELANPLRDTAHSRDVNPYDPNLWTLPVEYGCSMLVFALLAATYRFRPFVRMGTVSALVLFCLARAEHNVFLFLGGVLLADIRTYLSLREEATPPQLPVSSEGTAPTRRCSLAKPAALLPAFAVSLYLLSIPQQSKGAAASPGYGTLSSLIPEVYRSTDRADYFWVPLSALLLVATLDYAPFLQRVFTSRPAQYLGDISFALYLVHGPLLWSYGAWLAPRLIPAGEGISAWGYGWGVVLCYLCFWPVVVWVADLVMRGVDGRSVAVARWVYNKLKS